jgi:WD40 repeat protein
VAAAVAHCLLGALSLAEATGVTHVAATVVRVLTPEGTLVVESDDPAVKVTIEGDGDLVISGAGPQEVRLKAGSYKLRATKDGKPVNLDHDLVTINRGDREVVKVRLVRPAAAAGPAVPDRPPTDGRHRATVRMVAYSPPDGMLLASGGEDSVVIIRDADTFRERARLPHTGWIWGIAFSPDGSQLLTTALSRMRLWDVKTATELPTFRGHVGSVLSVAFSPDGRRVLAGGNQEDRTLRLFDAKTGDELRQFKGHSAIVWNVAISPDGHRALSGSGDGTVRLWDVDTGELLARLEDHEGWVRSVAFSPDGSLALSGGGGPEKEGHCVDCTVRVWDLKTQKVVQRYEGHGVPVWSVVFLPDGRRVLSAGGPSARMWDVRSGKDLRWFHGHSLGINSLTLSPDRRRLATGSDDHTVRLWDLETGNELTPEVAASPDGVGQGAPDGQASRDPFQSDRIAHLKIYKPQDKEDVESVSPPTGAIVLFDGQSLDGWVMAGDEEEPPTWKLRAGGIMESHVGNIKTTKTFSGRFKLHLEFRVPFMPEARGQERGNSGVYVQGRYEVQVLDGYGLKSEIDDCGAIFGIAAPLVNACKAPTVWQSYDFEFEASTFENGKKIAPAVITVYQNGIKIHDQFRITADNTQAGLGGDPSTPGPIMLQYLGSPVQYRNIWLVEQKRGQSTGGNSID